jgi:hypothetical protein
MKFQNSRADPFMRACEEIHQSLFPQHDNNALSRNPGHKRVQDSYPSLLESRSGLGCGLLQRP